MGKAAAGGIIRDWTGQFIKGFQRNIGAASVLASELWGLSDFFTIAEELKISNSVILDCRDFHQRRSNMFFLCCTQIFWLIKGLFGLIS